jgi:hypothetical protein
MSGVRAHYSTTGLSAKGNVMSGIRTQFQKHTDSAAPAPIDKYHPLSCSLRISVAASSYPHRWELVGALMQSGADVNLISKGWVDKLNMRSNANQPKRWSRGAFGALSESWWLSPEDSSNGFFKDGLGDRPRLSRCGYQIV